MASSKNSIDFWSDQFDQTLSTLGDFFDAAEAPKASDEPYAPALEETKKRAKKAEEARSQSAEQPDDFDSFMKEAYDDSLSEENVGREERLRTIEREELASARANAREAEARTGPTASSGIPTEEGRYVKGLFPGTDNSEVELNDWYRLVDTNVQRSERRQDNMRDNYKVQRTVDLLTGGVFPWGWSGPVEHRMIPMTRKDG